MLRQLSLVPGVALTIFSLAVLVMAWYLPPTGRVRAALAASRWAGLAMVIPVFPLDPNQNEDSEVGRKRAEIATRFLCRGVESSRKVDLLVASGYHFIGCSREGHRGWLFDVLDKNAESTTLRVLLLDPESEDGQARAEAVMGSYGPDSYARGVEAVLWTLKRWRDDRNMNVEVRKYREAPIWQFVKLPATLWLLMSAGGRSTVSSPLFVLKRGARYGLAWGLEAVWERRWGQRDTVVVDLDAVHEPDWSTVVRVVPS